MTKKEDKNKKVVKEPAAWRLKMRELMHNETVRFVSGLTLVIFSVYLLLAFVSFFFTGAADQSLVTSGVASDLSSVSNQVQNYAGSRGAQLSNFLINENFGLASFFIVAFLAIAGLKLMKACHVVLKMVFIRLTFLMLWCSLFLGVAFQDTYADSFLYAGGLHGYNVGLWLQSQIGVPGVWLLLLLTLLIYLAFRSVRLVISMRHFFAKPWKRKPKPAKGEAAAEEATEQPLTTEEVADEQPVVVPLYTAPESMSEVRIEMDEEEEEEIPVEDTEEDSASLDLKVDEPADVAPAEPMFEVETVQHEEDMPAEGKMDEPYDPTKELSHYKLPTLDLMRKLDNDEPSIDMEEQQANKNRIIETLRSFGIEISSIKATVGPTVTLYEITPNQGVRISKIRGLEDDIALSLSAEGIRIIAPIPGKGTIGIEVPNRNPRVVSGQSVIGSKKFRESSYELPVALGKTITNEVFMFDLCKMPHVLVAGATGQGKSVGLNAIITSLLYKKHPAELKFVLVDPKKVEFSIYSAIENHFLAELPDAGEPIITDVTKVVQTLNSVCVEMDNRYDLLKAAQVRNVKEYNRKFTERKLNPQKGRRYLPYIVVVIDEFGDLIMTAGKEVELPIARIAQLARAVGIHMIIATQRPTTNIITGTIKANFPARIAFRVSAMMDSRTILDRPGANRLIGKGDMLFLQGGDPVRVQCAFIDTPEVEDITHYIARQQGYPTPYYLPEYTPEGGDMGESFDASELGKSDPLFEDAARLIVIHQQGSTSLIQRKFSIGYNRAGRIMDQLERAGIVGPVQGSKPRDVLCSDERDLDMKLGK